MYTIIAGTNRVGSNSYKVGKSYADLLLSLGIQSSLHSLEGLDLNNRSESLVSFEKDVLIPSQKFIFIVPEYNGSFPGVLKSMIDFSDIKQSWNGKKALLVGVATGRGGNIRGLDHFTGILNYMNVFVHPNKLPISLVHELMGEMDKLTDEKTLKTINSQIIDFINF
jgi:NAD(P)H-dependent FMN reductase